MGVANYLSTLDLSPAATQSLREKGLMDGMAPPGADWQAPPAPLPVNPPSVGPPPVHAAPSAAVRSFGAAPVEWVPGPEEGSAPSPAAPVGPPAVATSAPQAEMVRTAPAMVIPGGWSPSQRAFSRSSAAADPEQLEAARASTDAAAGHQLTAADKVKEAADRETMAEAVYNASRAEAARVTEAKLQGLAEERQAYHNSQLQKFDELQAQANSKVDVEAAQGPLGAQLMSAIAVGLGAFGASLTGGPNTAMQIVQGNIDRKIAAQQANIRTAQDALKSKQSLYAQNMLQFDDKRMAALATKAQYLEQTKAMADQFYAQNKGTMNEADYAAMLGKIEEKRAATQKEFAVLSQTKTEEHGTEVYRAPQVIGGGGGGGGAKSEGNVVVLSDGTHVSMPNSETQNKAIEKIQYLTELQSMDKQAIKLRREAETVDPILDRGKYNELYGRLQAMNDRKIYVQSLALGQGVVKEDEYKRAQDAPGSYTSGLGFFKGNPMARSSRDTANSIIQNQMKDRDDEQKNLVKAAGGEIVKKEYLADDAGNISKRARLTGQGLRPDQVLAPDGFKPLDPRLKPPTAGRPLSETTPRAPVVATGPSGIAAAAQARPRKGGR